MEKLLDCIFWCLNNPTKIRKVLIIVFVLLLILAALVAIIWVAEIPAVIEHSITKK